MHPPLSRTLFDLLAEQANRAPDQAVAMTMTGAVTTAELVVRARRVARYLQADGIGRGSRVGLLDRKSVV